MESWDKYRKGKESYFCKKGLILVEYTEREQLKLKISFLLFFVELLLDADFLSGPSTVGTSAIELFLPGIFLGDE
jgi:hypothetical protein